MDTNTVWWQSKTLWVSFISMIALAAQSKWGFVIPIEVQGFILTIIMAALRLITKGPVVASTSETAKPGVSDQV